MQARAFSNCRIARIAGPPLVLCTSQLKFPICVFSRTGCEMLTFVRCTMEWLGGLVSNEDVSEETCGKTTTQMRKQFVPSRYD
jgi:hypothetical protein